VRVAGVSGASETLIIRELQVENFRNLKRVEIEAHPRLNFFHGSNGAGKTSLLEAVVVLSRGRSFRTTQAVELIGPFDSTFRIYALTEGPGGAEHRLGLERSGRRWRGRKDGVDLSQLSELTRALPLVLMEPDSHLLVSGPPEVRRRYLDWGMFHVEPGFLEAWRSFSRALKQRNAALRKHQQAMLDSLDAVLARHGERLSRYRQRHFDSISANISKILTELDPALAAISLDYQAGWHGEEYGATLSANRSRDLERGQTTSGPHRADMALSSGSNPARAVLSRGEQKLVAAALVLTQAEQLAGAGEKPLILLDDLASEFDGKHFESVLHRALACGAQVWVTGTREAGMDQPCARFHVEQGTVREVV
jgi:DNA replication and repair protein RecF